MINTRDKLNPQVRKLVISNGHHLQDVADAVGRSLQTSRRWFLINDENLKRIEVVAILTKITGLTKEEIFIPIEEKQSV